MQNKSYDVIVVGGGHAGVEAALASARLGICTLLLTHSLETIGQMSCNPAIGGIGKGHLVKEIDALGGLMARAIDHAGIQFRRLNARKGPAVQATRAQADRNLYKAYVQHAVQTQANLWVMQQGVDDLLISPEQSIMGVVTQCGITFRARAVVLTVGTFLGGKIHIGHQQTQGGRAGDLPATRLAQKMRSYNFPVGRLKTGTPPRIDARSVNFDNMVQQPGDTPIPVFSFLGTAAQHPQQIPCHITYTNVQTHQIIADNIDSSAMYSGAIEGAGPRYCPSIEDKIIRFADKSQHQIFVEPEGLSSTELYPNGLSTSLPFETQVAFIRSIKGFENAHLTRPGYAIEYDYFDPSVLKPSLETPSVHGLFFAGQINGTTGYEEAAAQGIMAGTNAALFIKGNPAFILKRHQAYIGVLIDDLCTQGTQEPYRMFTSRAEYRLALREDNADQRLTPLGHAIGLIDATRWRMFNEKMDRLTSQKHQLMHHWIQPTSDAAQRLNSLFTNQLSHEVNAYELLKRPECDVATLYDALQRECTSDFDMACAVQGQIDARYEGYLQRQQKEVDKLNQLEHRKIPECFDYQQVKGLSRELTDKCQHVKPCTLGQASRIPGMTPAALSVINIYLQKQYA